jgi:hypothetical protein
MSEHAIASTEYGDLVGTVSIDGRQGHSLWRLRDRAVGIPADYEPIGVRIAATATTFQVRLLAVDRDMIEAAGSLKAWAAEPGKVIAFEFPVEVSAAELLGLLYCFNLVATVKAVPGEKVRVREDC